MTFTNALGGLGVVLLCALAPRSALIAQRGAGAAGTPIALDATTTILLGADEPPALIEAARDLASDFEKVLGQKPRIVQRREEAGRATVLIGYRSALVQSLRSAPAGAQSRSRCPSSRPVGPPRQASCS